MNPSPIRDALLDDVDAKLTKHRDAATSTKILEEVLEKVLQRFSCVTGTVHRWNETTRLFELVCQKGIPPPVIEKIRTIPMGKGMAGIAAERKEPVQVCNLQTDASGVVRPGAKETRVEGAVACPMLVDGKVRSTLGIAKSVPYEFTKDEIALLSAIAARVGKCFA